MTALEKLAIVQAQLLHQIEVLEKEIKNPELPLEQTRDSLNRLSVLRVDLKTAKEEVFAIVNDLESLEQEPEELPEHYQQTIGNVL